MVTFNYPRSNFIGFDHIWNEIERAAGHTTANEYPKHNVVKLSDDKFAIELALAGFKQDELDIEHRENVLTVKGGKVKSEGLDYYIHKGISTKDFIKTFRLASDVVIDGATFIDGMLTISLSVVVPEERKPKKIAINKDRVINRPEVLLENKEQL